MKSTTNKYETRWRNPAVVSPSAQQTMSVPTNDYTNLSQGGYYGLRQWQVTMWSAWTAVALVVTAALCITKTCWFGKPKNIIYRLYLMLFGADEEKFKGRAETALEVIKTLKGVIVFWLILDSHSFIAFTCSVPPPLVGKEPFSGSIKVEVGGAEGYSGPLPCHPKAGWGATEFNDPAYVGLSRVQYMNATGFSTTDVEWMIQACDMALGPPAMLYGFATVFEMLFMVMYTMLPARLLFSHYRLHAGLLFMWALYWGPLWLHYSRFRTDAGYQTKCIAPNLSLGAFAVGLIFSYMACYMALIGLHTEALHRVASWMNDWWACTRKNKNVVPVMLWYGIFSETTRRKAQPPYLY